MAFPGNLARRKSRGRELFKPKLYEGIFTGNKVCRRCDSWRGEHSRKEVLLEKLDALSEFTRKLFWDEEKYMLEINYPEYEQHKEKHKKLMAQLNKLKADYAAVN